MGLCAGLPPQSEPPDTRGRGLAGWGPTEEEEAGPEAEAEKARTRDRAALRRALCKTCNMSVLIRREARAPRRRYTKILSGGGARPTTQGPLILVRMRTDVTLAITAIAARPQKGPDAETLFQ
mmetsp:Transcript_16043/g.46178  ORF Transcript_16043/g.46178 Transcript_16043/m.46178 type:complete len:123 (+) Transcript_16043:2-370(+)